MRRIGYVAVATVLAVGCGDDGAGRTSPDGGNPTADAGFGGREDAGDSGDPADHGDAGAQGGEALYDLGSLPEELQGIAWPAAPRTTREVAVTTAAEFEQAASESGTRILLRGDIEEQVFIRASDIDLVGEEGGRLADLHIYNGLERIRITGGEFGTIWLEIPARLTEPDPWRPELLIEDVLIQETQIVAPDIGILIRGRRVAVLNNEITAQRYSIWCGDTDDFRSEDVIIAGNRFDSSGAEATVRLVDALRTVVVENTMINGMKHNYRIHGTSDLNYAARNLLVDTGVMLGREETDAVGRQWFDDNILHHTAPALVQIDLDIPMVWARNNVTYTDVRECFVCAPNVAPEAWVLEGNQFHPYQPPPNDI